MTSNKNINLLNCAILAPSIYSSINYSKLWWKKYNNRAEQWKLNMLKKNNAWDRYIELNVNSYSRPTVVEKKIYCKENYYNMMKQLKKEERKLKFITSLPSVPRTLIFCTCLYGVNNYINCILNKRTI